MNSLVAIPRKRLSAFIGLMLILGSAAPGSTASFCSRSVTQDEFNKFKVVTQPYLGDRPASDDFRAEISSALPDSSVTVAINGEELRVTDSDGNTSVIAHLNSGDDYSGWRALWPLDDGWIYAEGAQYDSLLRLIRTDTHWRLAENIRIREQNESWLEAVLRWFLSTDAAQMERDQLTDIQEKRGYRFLTHTLRTILFLEDGQKIEEGKFIPMSTGPMRWYYGDISKLKVALVRDSLGRLYAYDGEASWHIKGPPVLGGWVNQPSPSDRTFIGSGSKAYEIRGTEPNSLALVELVPSDGQPIGWFYTVVLDGGTLAFVGRHAVYELDGETLRPIWKPRELGFIFGPSGANRLADGQLVISTRTGENDIIGKLTLLSVCHP